MLDSVFYAILDTFVFQHSEIRLSGEFKQNLLQGYGCLLHLKSGERVEGHFRDSCLHGIVRRLDSDGKLTFVGRYRNGRPVGKCWKMTRSEITEEIQLLESDSTAFAI